ncbi:hypothetical protein ES703_23246 [subsurface metagenome]
MDVHGENTPTQEEVALYDKLKDIQWLRDKYREVLDREEKLLRYLVKMLADFDLRIRALEGRPEGG